MIEWIYIIEYSLSLWGSKPKYPKKKKKDVTTNRLYKSNYIKENTK